MKMTDMIPVKINGQWDIILPRHRAERPEWFTKQGWEKARLQSLHDVIGAKHSYDPTVYYVGSEEAEMPALCQMWGSKVILFEPNPKVWSNAKAIWDANLLDEPITFQGFCSNETRIIDIPNGLQHGFPRCADDEIIAAHGFKELDKEAANYNQIKIDDISHIHNPDILAIDVEGSEGHVLRGAEQTLRKLRPRIYLSLHPEFMIMQYGEHAAELRKWIMDLGYKEILLDFALHETHLLYEPIND